jgi:transglutaminase-like putative cysteine protease
MMIYEIQQTTRCDYVWPVPFAKHVLRMLPVNRPGQHVLATHVNITPKPARQNILTDFFGNHVIQVDLDVPHESLVVSVSARVQVEPASPYLPDLTLSWENVRDQAIESSSIDPHSPVHFLYRSRMIEMEPEIGAYATESFLAGRALMDCASDLMLRIYRDFHYDPKATEVDTSALEAFRQRNGVCQDFAHIMISGLRWLGVPAAYVSGYLRTIPPEGQPRLQGADATHAWVLVWCGHQTGWCGLDPTNACLTGEDHIVIAIGRDYADVSPVDGMIVIAGGQRMKVEVDVVPQDPRKLVRRALR